VRSICRSKATVTAALTRPQIEASRTCSSHHEKAGKPGSCKLLSGRPAEAVAA
jgi:hypothetical protein